MYSLNGDAEVRPRSYVAHSTSPTPRSFFDFSIIPSKFDGVWSEFYRRSTLPGKKAPHQSPCILIKPLLLYSALPTRPANKRRVATPPPQQTIPGGVKIWEKVTSSILATYCPSCSVWKVTSTS